MTDRIVLELDTANTTTYLALSEYEGREVWVQSESPCPHLSIRPACEAAPEHILCWDCYGAVTEVKGA